MPSTSPETESLTGLGLANEAALAGGNGHTSSCLHLPALTSIFLWVWENQTQIQLEILTETWSQPKCSLTRASCLLTHNVLLTSAMTEAAPASSAPLLNDVSGSQSHNHSSGPEALSPPTWSKGRITHLIQYGCTLP